MSRRRYGGYRRYRGGRSSYGGRRYRRRSRRRYGRSRARRAPSGGRSRRGSGSDDFAGIVGGLIGMPPEVLSALGAGCLVVLGSLVAVLLEVTLWIVLVLGILMFAVLTAVGMAAVVRLATRWRQADRTVE